MATVGERATLMDEGLGRWVLLAMTSASRISATVDAVVDLDRTQRSYATTRLKSRLAATGGPPYLVRWSGDERETLFFPGPDAYVSHQVVAAPLTASSDSGFRRLTFGEVDAEELRVQRRVGSTAPRRRGARR